MNLGKRLRRHLLFILVLLLAAVELPVIIAGHFTRPEPAEVMIVLGSRVIGHEPGPMLRPRLDEAVKLFRQGYAPAVIVSGAQGNDEEAAEAFVMRDYLIKQGIPGEKIITEAASFNTYQNLANSKAIMAEQGYQKALIVSSSSHIHRALTLARQLDIEAGGAPAPMAGNLYLVARQYLREGAAMFTLTLAGR